MYAGFSSEVHRTSTTVQCPAQRREVCEAKRDRAERGPPREERACIECRGGGILMLLRSMHRRRIQTRILSVHAQAWRRTRLACVDA
jgi:hypothetical protein